VDRVAYCTAPLQSLPNDPDVVNRQQIYLRALDANPRIDIHLGKFVRRTPRLFRIPDADCLCCSVEYEGSPCGCCRTRTTQVVRFEEKGSDVQLAVQLVSDAHRGLMDLAVVISNDSDLQPALDLVRDLNISVMVASPHPSGKSLVGTTRGFLNKGRLRTSQMPRSVVDAQGRTVTRPRTWE